jgi:hypothetical protein
MKETVSLASLALIIIAPCCILGFAPLSLAPRHAFTLPSTTARLARQDPAVLDKQETQATAISSSDDDKADAPVVTTTVAVAASLTAGPTDVDELCVVQEEEMTETQKLMKQVKDAGVAGVISYAVWELGFWLLSVPVVILGYKTAVGHFPDLSDKDDLAKLGAEAFAFVNFARFAVPLRIGLALSTTPWIQNNIVDKYLQKKEDVCVEPPPEADDANSASGSEDDVNGQAVTGEASVALRKVPRWRSFLRLPRRGGQD